MDIRIRLFIILLMTGVVAAVWAFPAWWPLLNTETIIERFPGLEPEDQPAFIGLPENVQRAFLELRADPDVRPGLALALVRERLNGSDFQAPEADDPFEPPSTTILRRGEFREVDPIRGAEGTVTIYQRADLSRMLRIEEFRSTRAPGVHVIFTRNPDPFDSAGVGVDYIDIGELKGNVGAQNYEVPDGVDFNQYPILALYSPQYDWVVSAATLR